MQRKIYSGKKTIQPTRPHRDPIRTFSAWVHARRTCLSSFVTHRPRVEQATGARPLVGPAHTSRNGTPVHVSRHSAGPQPRPPSPLLAAPASKRPGVSSDKSLAPVRCLRSTPRRERHPARPSVRVQAHVRVSTRSIYAARAAPRMAPCSPRPLLRLEERRRIYLISLSFGRAINLELLRYSSS